MHSVLGDCVFQRRPVTSWGELDSQEKGKRITQISWLSNRVSHNPSKDNRLGEGGVRGVEKGKGRSRENMAIRGVFRGGKYP